MMKLKVKVNEYLKDLHNYSIRIEFLNWHWKRQNKLLNIAGLL